MRHLRLFHHTSWYSETKVSIKTELPYLNYETRLFQISVTVVTLPGSNKFADMQENILHCSRHG
jgi:hypothetical protein